MAFAPFGGRMVMPTTGASKTRRVPRTVQLEVAPKDENRKYLRTKREKMGHLLVQAGDEPTRRKD